MLTSPQLEEINEVTRSLHNRQRNLGVEMGGQEAAEALTAGKLPGWAHPHVPGVPVRHGQHPMLLLLAVWVLAVGLWLEAEALEPPVVEKLCGREFVRTVIYVCGQPRLRWSRSAILTQELMDTGPDGNTKLDEAVASSERQRKSPKTFSGGPPNWRGPRGTLRRSRDLLSDCCNKGCTKKEISMYC